jgi:translation initiation factor IF-1
MKDKFKFKRNAEVIEIIDIKIIRVRLEDGNEVLATISSKTQMGNPRLEIGQNIIVFVNPYEEKRVQVHNDSWGIR